MLGNISTFWFDVPQTNFNVFQEPSLSVDVSGVPADRHTCCSQVQYYKIESEHLFIDLAKSHPKIISFLLFSFLLPL